MKNKFVLLVAGIALAFILLLSCTSKAPETGSTATPTVLTSDTSVAPVDTVKVDTIK